MGRQVGHLPGIITRRTVNKIWKELSGLIDYMYGDCVLCVGVVEEGYSLSFLVSGNKKTYMSSLPTLSSPLICPWRTLASFRTNFQAFLSLAIFLQPLTPICFRSFSTSFNHLFLSFSMHLSPSEIFLKHLLHSSFQLSKPSEYSFSSFWNNIRFTTQIHKVLTGDYQQTWYKGKGSPVTSPVWPRVFQEF